MDVALAPASAYQHQKHRICDSNPRQIISKMNTLLRYDCAGAHTARAILDSSAKPTSKVTH
eukprot:7377195-Prymnesium_polylepis.1